MRIGHTGLTWGIPGDVEQAYREVAELGFLGFETFGTTILEWNSKPGGYKTLVDRYGIPTVAAYCTGTWIDPATEQQDFVEVRRIADALKELDGHTLVLQAGSRPDVGYTADQFKRLADALNKVGDYGRSIGLIAGIHPHTQTAVETREDIDAILQLLDAALVGFAPDTGQIAKGGSDILDVMRTYRQYIRHVHLKDWSGKYELDEQDKEIDATGYLNYEPIGNGVLPIPKILDLVPEEVWVTVELDREPQAPHSPYEAAAISRRYLGQILGNRVDWKH